VNWVNYWPKEGTRDRAGPAGEAAGRVAARSPGCPL